jgi:polar amino acid transport system substrate-binding protein
MDLDTHAVRGLPLSSTMPNCSAFSEPAGSWPTAFEVQSELDNGVIVGQLPAGSEKAEQFGIVLDKGSPLTACVSKAIDDLGNDGELFKLQKVWLTGAGNAPLLS